MCLASFCSAKWYLSPENSDMCYCYVERVKGQHTTSFNLYREDTGEFMIAAACASNMTGGLVFTNFKDCHLRKVSAKRASLDEVENSR